MLSLRHFKYEKRKTAAEILAIYDMNSHSYLWANSYCQYNKVDFLQHIYTILTIGEDISKYVPSSIMGTDFNQKVTSDSDRRTLDAIIKNLLVRNLIVTENSELI